MTRPTASGAGGRLLAVDALRGAAALMVLFLHARLLFGPSVKELWRAVGATADPGVLLTYASTVFAFGGYGVPLFFVLSGYCIHRRQAVQLAAGGRQTPPPDWADFARRRLLRLYPTYVVALLLTYAVDQFLISRTVVEPPPDHSPVTLLASLLTVQGVVTPKFGTNNVFWTLALEMHLYAAYPVLFYLCRRAGPWVTLTVPLVAGVTWAVVRRACAIDFPHAENGGVIFVAYWLTWASGMAVAEAEVGRLRVPGGRVGVAVLAAAGLAWTGFFARRGADDIEGFGHGPLFAGVLAAALTPGGRRLAATLAGKLLAFVGEFSYSLYATHVQFLLFVVAVVAVPGTTGEAVGRFDTILPMYAISAGAVGFAWLFYQAVERWSIRASSARGRKLPTNPLPPETHP